MMARIFLSLIILIRITYSFGQSADQLNCGVRKDLLPHTEGDISFVDFSVNNITLLKSKLPLLRGNGITLCLKENSPNFSDPDITKHLKISTLKSSIVSDHATALATLLVGDGVTSPQSKGISSAAKLICTDFQNLMPESNDFYKEQNISIVNHSYGTTVENFYGVNAQAYDVNAESMPQLLHIFSAGNLGYAPGTGIYSGITGNANLTGNFKQSKNSLAVGSVDAEGTPRPWSSAGPAYDGRLKPEVCAFSDEGTSGSAAIASGVAALLQEYYFNENHNYPAAALLKAILINSTMDVGKKGIDWQTGYGNINAYRALKTLEYKHIIEGTVNEAEDITIPLSIPANARNLKVTLTWTDPPANVNNSVALVNDLDLEVIGSTRWLPWILNAYPKIDSLQKQAIRGYDHWNTTEQVTIDNPCEEYFIHVSAFKAIKQQAFYIAYQWDSPNEFLWISPVANDKLINDNNVILRWESTLAIDNGNLEISTDDGQSWNVIQNDIPLSQGMLNWTCPNTFSKARLRMIAGGQSYLSDDFIISPVTTLAMSYRCGDSLQLQWKIEKEINSIKSYRLLHYDNNGGLWENSGQLTSQSTTLGHVEETDVFAVVPVMLNDSEGIRSESLIIQDQNVFCFYKNVTATVVNDSIQIQCELSTTDDVGSITFQKLKNDNSVINLETISTIPGESYYSMYDKDLIDGDNRYRVELTLTNGKIILSDFETAAYLKEKNFAVFPNPADSQTFITIFSKETEAFTIALFDCMGRSVLEQKSFEQQINLSVIHLKSGIYVYRICSGTHQPYTGKIILK